MKSAVLPESLEHQGFEVSTLESSTFSENFPFEIPGARRGLLLQCFMGGWPGEKKVDRKPVFPQIVLENQYSLLTHFYLIGLTKRKKIIISC